MILRVRRLCLGHSRTVLAFLLLSLVKTAFSVDSGGINMGSGSSYGEKLQFMHNNEKGLRWQFVSENCVNCDKIERIAKQRNSYTINSLCKT